MKKIINPFSQLSSILAVAVLLLGTTACHDKLNAPLENKEYTEETDYSVSANMISPLVGAYAELYKRGWEDFAVISVRGDDVNAGGLGDQQPYSDADRFRYDNTFWMFNQMWSNFYSSIFKLNSAIEQINRYRDAGANAALANQYVAEVTVMRAWYLLNLARTFGGIFVPETADNTELFATPLRPYDEVMQIIAEQLDQTLAVLPNMHPRSRSDIKGGVTKYTALALKAVALLEKKDYSGVAAATSQIIASGFFSLEQDFYELFKLTKGKLNPENVFEFQYSDYGTPSGDENQFAANSFVGPQKGDGTGFLPENTLIGGGWGFYEPSMKFIKFMLDRGERIRLKTAVLFTNRGLDSLKKVYPGITVPEWMTDHTGLDGRSGDRILNFQRAVFSSGKHYIPSKQIVSGRTSYNSGRNQVIIRYAEILLMHAEALTRGASSSAMTADAAVNALRTRAGLGSLSGVTAEQVMDEKFAELAMEWGVRFYDMARLEKHGELSYEGRTFTAGLKYIPYPQAQLDMFPILKEK
ncbi:MAG: RagB/SusD family nutrient uptake outer membrane protein [Prevotellaceae bacterium]|jgi:hypothetical protein|nr:RagB/SusD family nutrient uptake outer membrane protein [Prevotellaceae bacterium]